MTNYINDETISKVGDLADIVQVISDYLPLKKSGANYVGLCPFHNEKTPSFTVSESKQFFKCFGCGAGGDVVTFIMKQENLSFPESIRFLGDKLGIEIEDTKPVDNEVVKKRDRAYEINRDAARFFHSNLIKNKKALKYLYDRDINDKIIKQFGIGYALDNWNALYNHLSFKGYLNDEIEKLGLIGERSDNKGYYDKFRNRIIFPIIDTRSRVLGFGGRVLDDKMPKYLNSQETLVFNKGNHLYGLNLLSKFSDRKKIILVEGYMDVIALFKEGIDYSVASLGTALTEKQAKLLKRYGRNVYICFDSDLAGINATNKAIKLLLNEEVNPKIILLDNYKDPDDFLKAEGSKKFKKQIDNALNHIDYGIHINKQKYDISKSEGKIKFTIEIAKIIRDLKSPIEKDVYINKIAKEIGISREAIEKEIGYESSQKNYNRKSRSKYKKKENKEASMPMKTILPSAIMTAEIDLIKLMIINKDYYDMLINEDILQDLENIECKKILNIMKTLYLEDEILDEEVLYEKSKKIENINIELIDTIFKREVNFSPENINQMIRDLLNTLKTNKIKSKRNSVKKKIKELELKENKSPLEIENFSRLCVELINLNKELNLIRHEDGG